MHTHANIPDQQTLSRLGKTNQPLAISFYLPFITEHASTAANPNPIQLKNAIREAKHTAEAEGFEDKLVEQALERTKALVDDFAFWTDARNKDTIIFTAPDTFNLYHLPNGGVDFSVTVGDQFYTEPLRTVLEHNQQFLILTLSHNQVELYEADRFYIEPLPVKNLPRNMEDALNIDELAQDLQTHTIAPGRAAASEAFHGHYDAKTTDKQLLEEYFRVIDRKLQPTLDKKRLPLILAGVDYLLPIYRKVNTSKYLLPEGVKGNFDRSNLQTIQEKSWNALITQIESSK